MTKSDVARLTSVARGEILPVLHRHLAAPKSTVVASKDGAGDKRPVVPTPDLDNAQPEETFVRRFSMNAIRMICQPPEAHPPLCVRVCSSWKDAEMFRAEWESLLTASGSSIFSTLEWLSAWWRSYGSAKQLLLLLFFASDEELVGVAPLYLDTRRVAFGRNLKVLHLVGDGSEDSDNLDFLIRPGYERVCTERFLSWLQTCEWDLCVLATLQEHSPFRHSLVRSLRSSRWPLLETRAPHFFISLPNSWERYLRSLMPGFRPLLTRYPRRLQAKHQVRIYRSTTEDLEKNLLKLFLLHQRRWQERGFAGAFRNAARRQLYHEVARLFSRRGWLEFWLMDLDGTTVAAQFCLRFGDTIYLLQEGFDPNYAQEKVGYALRASTLEHLIGEGVQRYDFLGGADAYKLRFGVVESSYRTIEFARPSTLGSAYLARDRFGHHARQWAHANLPQPLLHLLRRALVTVKNLPNPLVHH